jgi:peroxiredoxin
MTENMMQVVSNDRFPTITGTSADGDTITLPEDADGSWSVLLFYRGHW